MTWHLNSRQNITLSNDNINYTLSQAYAIEAREDWVQEWPGQVVLCVSQIYWTSEVHEAVRGGPAGLQEYYDKLQAQLADIVKLVRGKLSKQTRITLGALVTIDVHARDVVMDMIEKGQFLFSCRNTVDTKRM